METGLKITLAFTAVFVLINLCSGFLLINRVGGIASSNIYSAGVAAISAGAKNDFAGIEEFYITISLLSAASFLGIGFLVSKILTKPIKKMEAEKIQAQKLAAIIEDANEAIIGENLNGVVTEWNRGAENLYGWTAGEMIGQNIKIVVPPEKYGEIDDILMRVGRGEKIDHYQTTRLKKNGQTIDTSVFVAPIRDYSGKVMGVSVIAIDITKEKQIDRAKTEFVSLASHQLKTPLSTINWYSEMLLDEDAGKLKKKQKEFLGQIYTGNKRMVELVNALLNVSRLELGTFMIEPEFCSLKEIAKLAVSDVLPHMQEKNQILEEKYAENLDVANVDKKLIDIIIQNLLSNAMKYTPEKGKIKLSISKDENYFVISVTDTGMGIPVADQGKIFTKFFRADNVRMSDVTGTGLGLYMVKSILEQSGGEILFNSKENQGTVFFVKIPIDGMKKKEGTKQLS